VILHLQRTSLFGKHRSLLVSAAAGAARSRACAKATRVWSLAIGVPKEHPRRRVKELADAALTQLSPLFDEMYSAFGRPSIPPERLLKGSLPMALHTGRSERMFCEQLNYNP
jgi:hypothetical protein